MKGRNITAEIVASFLRHLREAEKAMPQLENAIVPKGFCSLCRRQRNYKRTRHCIQAAAFE